MMRTKPNPTDRKVLHLIARANVRQLPSPSIRELCAATGRSTGAIYKSIQWLVQEQYIVDRGRRRGARTLHIHPERIAVEKRRGDTVRAYYQVF